MKKQRLIAAAIGASLLLTFSGESVSAAGKTTTTKNDQVYTVKSGDSLSVIAKQNHVSIAVIKSLNGLKADKVYAGQKLIVSGKKIKAKAKVFVSRSRKKETTYRVQRGDSLSVIAARHHLSVSQLKSMNHLTTNTAVLGKVLKVAQTAPSKVSRKSVAVSPKSTKKLDQVSTANAIMTEAKKYIGTPYVWGGNTISGFDCSGYLKYVYAKVGITIPRTAATIWNATNAVAAPKPGDMVFFETYMAGPSHLGIYLGSNKFIHAGSSGVKISDMNFGFWKTRYLGAKSIF